MERRMTRTRHPRTAEPCGRFQCEDQEGFEDRFINEFIGRGVFTTKTFSKDDFLLVYKGELVTADEGYRREESYHPNLGSFLFFFKDGAKCFCVDATFSKGLGRLVNDAPSNKSICNSVVRKVKEGSETYLVLYALRDIKIGEELRYDYGVKDLPWRKIKGNKDSLKHERVQSSNGKVMEDRTDNVDDTGNLKNADMLHVDSLTSNVHFPIDITTSQEISSMNQSNCISAESLQRFQQWKPGLEPEECWINDEGINAYNALLARKFLKMGKAIYIFNSYFFQRLKRFESSAPEKCLDSVCKTNLLDKEAWVIPINDGAHWKVIIVNLIDKFFCLYDSIDHEEGGTKDIHVIHFQTVRNLIQRVHRWFGKEWTSVDWKQFIAEDTPKQSNSFDCGIFLLKVVDFVISGKPFSFSQVDISRFRMEMASEIIAMKLRSEDSEGFNGQMDQTVCTSNQGQTALSCDRNVTENSTENHDRSSSSSDKEDIISDIAVSKLPAHQSGSPSSCDEDVTINLPACQSGSPLCCDEDVTSNLPEHKTIRSGSQKHQDQDKENLKCAISKTKIVKKPAMAEKVVGKSPAKKKAKKPVPASRKSTAHTPWTGEEKEAVFKYLAPWIRQGRVPGKRDCENCIAKSTGALERRDWTAVKYYVKNQNDKRKRVLTTRNNSL